MKWKIYKRKGKTEITIVRLKTKKKIEKQNCTKIFFTNNLKQQNYPNKKKTQLKIKNLSKTKRKN